MAPVFYFKNVPMQVCQVVCLKVYTATMMDTNHEAKIINTFPPTLHLPFL